MTLRMDKEWDGHFDFDVDKLAGELLDAGADAVSCPYELEVGILLTGNEAIRELNLEFRDLDAPTDVLSFPMLPLERPCAFGGLEEDGTLFSPESGELLLGDLAVSCEKAIEQAGEYGHSVKREFSFLFVHGLLHLFGYDHEEAKDAALMEAKQEEILSGMGIGR